MYTKAVWYSNDVAKEYRDPCKVESNIDVLLNHIADATVAVSPDHYLNDFAHYNYSEKDDD